MLKNQTVASHRKLELQVRPKFFQAGIAAGLQELGKR
jgi:hypothetical protein